MVTNDVHVCGKEEKMDFSLVRRLEILGREQENLVRFETWEAPVE
jgi:hypothetical protein